MGRRSLPDFVACAMAFAFAVALSGAAAHPARAAPAPAVEFLSDVKRDWRAARKQGIPDLRARRDIARRALAVADEARGRERYEALRFVATLDPDGASSEMLELRDRALERVFVEYLHDGELMGECVLRVLRDDGHDRALRDRIRAQTRSPSVRAACELRPLEADMDTALAEQPVSRERRLEVAAALERIASEHGEAKHPLTRETWAEFANGLARRMRDLVLVGDELPAFDAVDLRGGRFSSHALAGRATLLCFGGEWCKPAQAQVERLVELSRSDRGERLAIVVVASDASQDVARAGAALRTPALIALWDGPAGTEGPLATRMGVRAWPTWCLIDVEGRVRERWRGAPTGEELDAALARVLPVTAR